MTTTGIAKRAESGEITRLLDGFEGTREEATNRLLPVVYSELRQIASRQLAREAEPRTLQPTALVHEAYLRLVGGAQAPVWENRAHFFGAAAESMRRIMIDAARARTRKKRQRPDHPDPALQPDPSSPLESPADRWDEILVLDEALDRLSLVDPRKAELVKLRFFAGLTTGQAAEALGLSLRSAEREWAFARVWLYREIDGHA